MSMMMSFALQPRCTRSYRTRNKGAPWESVSCEASKTTSQGENMGSWLSPSQGAHWGVPNSLLEWVVS